MNEHRKWGPKQTPHEKENERESKKPAVCLQCVYIKHLTIPHRLTDEHGLRQSLKICSQITSGFFMIFFFFSSLLLRFLISFAFHFTRESFQTENCFNLLHDSKSNKKSIHDTASMPKSFAAPTLEIHSNIHTRKKKQCNERDCFDSRAQCTNWNWCKTYRCKIHSWHNVHQASSSLHC